MRIWNYNNISKEDYSKLILRAETDISNHVKIAQEIIDDVRKDGDSAIIKYNEKFDKVKLTPQTLKVSEEEIEKAFKTIEPGVKEAIEYSLGNIFKLHKAQMPNEINFINIDDGILVGEKNTPIDNVCLYVPQGKGAFPSVMLMLGVPAVVAGVKKIVVISPPNEKGEINAGTLVGCKLMGITEIYKCGGAQGVAAVAYGTQTIPKCLKILGPGNTYVTAAKRILSNIIDIGCPAGPSESIIIADEFANPKVVAKDMLIEAEHGNDSSVVLCTHSKELAEKVKNIIDELLKEIPEWRRNFCESVFNNYGGIIITQNIEESIEFTNDYAPEHMEILTQNPFDILPKIKSSGEILLGEHTPTTLANFVLGPNAILPTGGKAKTYSGISVRDFMKMSSIGYCTKEGYDKVRNHAHKFALYEGFITHAKALEDRY